MAVKVLVTGSDGFLGTHLVRALEGRGYDVFKLDKTRGHDLIVPSRWGTFLEGVDVVYHLAALADVRSGKDQPMKVFEQNTQATLFLLEMMRRHGAKRIVFTSSAAVYGDLPTVPMSEDGPMPVQTSLYGASKLAGEALLTAYARTFGFQVGIARLVQLLGPGYKHGHLWDVYQKVQTDPHHLFMDGAPDSERQYLHVADAVLGLTMLAHAAISDEPVIWNLAQNGTLKIEESVQLLLESLSLDPEIEWAGWRHAGDSEKIEVSTARADTAGWKALHGIPAAIQETAKSFSHE